MAEFKYKSGLCSIGCHEGTTPKNTFGNPLPTCRSNSNTCACECHQEFDKLFAMTEEDRVLVDESSYVPDKGDFVMPDLAEVAELRRTGSPDAPPERIESPDPALVPATVARTFAPTATGRSGRGELEQQVDAICKIWAVERDVAVCTPKYISEQIRRTYAINEPSVGAIGAVFDRWTKLGYADCQRKPVRFVAYTEAGREHGLDGLKERARRQQAMTR